MTDSCVIEANAGTLKDRLRRLERCTAPRLEFCSSCADDDGSTDGHRPRHPSEPPTREAASVVIFEMENCAGIDGSALLIMHEAVKSYRERSVLVYWVRLPVALRSTMEKAGIFELSSSGNGEWSPLVCDDFER